MQEQHELRLALAFGARLPQLQKFGETRLPYGLVVTGEVGAECGHSTWVAFGQFFQQTLQSIGRIHQNLRARVLHDLVESLLSGLAFRRRKADEVELAKFNSRKRQQTHQARGPRRGAHACSARAPFADQSTAGITKARSPAIAHQRDLRRRGKLRHSFQ